FNENNSTILNVCIPLADNTKISPEGKNYFHYSDIKTVKVLVIIAKHSRLCIPNWIFKNAFSFAGECQMLEKLVKK
ncbi:hypothetical protein D505_00070, partial [Elizabethkingia anophelis R26]|uniref:hypothetical protein n=1 Tax=Elizabethkingia anophelis TaxID=1117645 RepID=UPI0002ABE42D